MFPLWKAVVAFVVLLAARLLHYQTRLWQITRLRRRYFEYLGDEKASAVWLVEQTSSFRRMIRECNAGAGLLTRAEEAGYGYIRPVRFAAEENLALRDAEVAHVVDYIMLRIQGHYRAERNRTLSPLYWIEYVAFLPREVARYIGVGSEKPVVRVSDVAWWVLIAWEVVAWITGKGSLLGILRTVAK